MKTIKFCLISFVLLFWVNVGYAEEPKMTPETELLVTLKNFASQHSLSGDALNKMLGHIVLEGKNWKKGGVGALGNNIYIFTDSPRNSLKIAGQTWEGKESTKQEIVLTDGQRILDSLNGADLSKIIIVLFSPSEVQYIDLSNATGGKFMREIEKSTPE